MREGDAEDSLSQARNLVQKRATPGILLLTTSLQILYSDHRIWELCGQLHKPQRETGSKQKLPKPVMDFCGELVKLLEVKPDVKDWEDFQLKKVIMEATPHVLLRGIALPDERSLPNSYLLMTMEEMGRREKFDLEQAHSIFRLTEREQVVLEYLWKGYTNKRIAQELRIKEQTVKEHVRHIMAKTKTTTRTGILMAVLNRGF